MYEIGVVNYAILTVLLIAAGVALVLGLRDILRRTAADRASFGPVNWRSFFFRGVLLSRLFKRPAFE